MKNGFLKKVAAATLAATMVISATACGNKADTTASDAEPLNISINDIKLGEDYTDISANLKFITHKTDIIDTVFEEYIQEFQELYPNVTIEYEGITSYATDITTRLTTGDWGDICMVPVSIDKNELGNYFTSFGTLEDVSTIYQENMLTPYSYDGQVYGIPSMANVQGIVYNKAVFKEAGITETPKTPDEFIEDLKLIKEKTEAIPLYTNFSAQWTMTAWDSYIDGGATGDPDFVNSGFTHGKDPFSDRGNGTGPYAVYDVLYRAVKEGLTEEDPTTTDWEGSKGMLNRGEVACMALGSWSITQCQEAGDNPDDIGYMAFPITVSGQQYATAGPDYDYGINKNSSRDQQIASMCYIKWLVEKSGFAKDQGGLSIVIGDSYPEELASLDGVELVVNNAPPAGEENLYTQINNDSELGINVSGNIPTQIVEEASTGSKTMEEMSEEWNASWTSAQEKNGVSIE